MTTSEVRSKAIARIGSALGPQVLATVYSLYRDEQDRLAALQPVAAPDRRYGPAPRNLVDLYLPVDSRAPYPIVLWVHGGGFLRGEKASPEHPFNAHVGRWAARHGMAGAVMNYRLAPDATWPSGGEDVIAAVEWLRSNARDYGADGDSIVLMGTSAGAAHIATALRLQPKLMARAAVLLSGLYGFTPLDERDELYYGEGARYAERMPREAVVATDLPLFVASAQHDPPRFQAEFLGLLGSRLEHHGSMPRAYVASGHNHFSVACHLGGEDERLSREIISFLKEIV